MKKSLIALAVVGAFSAPAFADTTLYGTVDAAVASLSTSGLKSDLIGVTGGLSTSRLGIRGAEDIGDGVKIVYNEEIALDSQTNVGFASAARQSLLGVAGGFGTVASGYLQTTGYDFGVKFDPTAGSSVSPLQNLTVGNAQFLVGSKAGATRAQRALAYISPNLSGFTVAVNYSTALAGLGNLTTASSANDVKVTATLASVNYEAGPLAVGGVYASTSNPSGASTADEKEYALGASYDLGAAKVFGTYQATHNGAAANAGNTNKLYSLSGVIPAGPGAVALSYAHAKIDTVASGKDGDGTSYTAAYLYGLSKTATLYGALSRTTNGSDTNAFAGDNSAQSGAGTAGASSTLVAVGLKKTF